MTLWIVLTVLTSIAAIVVAIPFIRRFDRGGDPAGEGIAVYRDQLAELEREQAQGLIDEPAAASARTEIERRIVAAAKAADSKGADLSPRMKTLALVAVAGWVVIGSTTLYAVTGKPEIASAPFRAGGQGVLAQLDGSANAGRNQPAATAQQTANTSVQAAGNVDDMIAALAARLRDNPDDADGWRMLGWSYFNTERYAEAAEAYGKAAALQPGRADLHSAQGETLVRAADGFVTTEAHAAFDKALALDANDARARFFKGLALEQDGQPAAAIDAWIAILKDAPTGADWEEGLRQRIQELAAASSIDISGRLPGPAVAVAAPPQSAGPTQADVEAAQSMSDGDRQAMIRGMVDRLAARLETNPNDPEGWIKLIRSRMVLGDSDAARGALNRAREVLANDPQSLSQVMANAAQLGITAN